MNQIISFWQTLRRKPLPLFLIGVGVFLLVLNHWLWPTPDEYLYASVARSIIAGLGGQTCLSCLNTEHPALVASVVAAFQSLMRVGPFNLIASRMPLILFPLGTMILLWRIAGKVVAKPSEQTWFLWLLLLIPGYFTLSTRLLLDVPLTFGLALLMYLLLIRVRPIWIGLALCLPMLTKGYGLLLGTPLVVGMYVLEAIEGRDKGVKSFLIDFPLKLLAAFSPPLTVAILILSSNILPYPRLLETNLTEYFGVGYLIFLKVILVIGHKISELFVAFFPSQAGQTIVQTIADKSQITITGGFPTALFDSPLQPETTGGFLRKLLLIYQYNFSEQDVSVFMLPLFVTGLVVRVRWLISLGKDWLKERADYLFLVLTLLFVYVNWHEVFNLIGFRLTVPIVLSLVYFGYWGTRAILVENNRLARRIFAVAFFVSLSLYIHSVLQIHGYGSVIATNSLVGALLKYKLFIFGIGFLAAFVFLWWYPNLKWQNKVVLIPVIILGFFLVKMLPFALEARAANQLFGYDYGLSKASKLLQELRLADERVATNVNGYVMHYYSVNLTLPNEGITPPLRTFREVYPEPYYDYRPAARTLTAELLEAQGIQYIFFVNKQASDQSLHDFDAMVQGLNLPVTVVEEAHNPLNGKVQWKMDKVKLPSS